MVAMWLTWLCKDTLREDSAQNIATCVACDVMNHIQVNSTLVSEINHQANEVSDGARASVLHLSCLTITGKILTLA